MNALSRREEDTLMKATKTYALKECDPLVKGTRNIFIFSTSLDVAQLGCLGAEFAECATGRTVSVSWACKAKYKEVQECISRLWVPFAVGRSWLTSDATIALDQNI
jgi:COX assembly protein 1